MAKPNTPITPLARAIEHKAGELRLLAAPDERLALDRLRDEAAALQSLIAEAARMQLLERPFDMPGAALFFPVLIESDEFTGYCLVSNLAADGMKAKVFAKFTRQQPIRVRLTAERVIQGTLVWSEDQQIGVRFEKKIDVRAVLSSLADAQRGPDRHARLTFKCLAEISVGDRFQFVEVADVSQRGLKVRTRLGSVGKKLTVQLHELDERDAMVRWSDSRSAGLVFTKPLSFPERAQFVPSAAVGF